MTEAVRYEADDGVATLTLARPDRLNAMDRPMLDQLLMHLERIASDDDVRIVVVTGEGRAFCAGGDMRPEAGREVVRVGEDYEAVLRHLMRSSELLREMPKVTIAAINGACAGAGLALACAADMRFAASTAVFATAFVPAGLSGDFGGTWTLPRIVGEGRARDLYMLAERIDASEALRIGLVSRVFPPEDFADRVSSVAVAARDLPALALRSVKANLNDGARVDFAELLDLEAKRVAECAVSDDARAAASTFGSARAPKPEGRP